MLSFNRLIRNVIITIKTTYSCPLFLINSVAIRRIKGCPKFDQKLTKKCQFKERLKVNENIFFSLDSSKLLLKFILASYYNMFFEVSSYVLLTFFPSFSQILPRFFLNSSLLLLNFVLTSFYVFLSFFLNCFWTKV